MLRLLHVVRESGPHVVSHVMGALFDFFDGRHVFVFFGQEDVAEHAGTQGAFEEFMQELRDGRRSNFVLL